MQRWIGDSGEVRLFLSFFSSSASASLTLGSLAPQPLLPQVFASQHPAMSMYESWQVRTPFLVLEKSTNAADEVRAPTAQQAPRRLPPALPLDLPLDSHPPQRADRPPDRRHRVPDVPAPRRAAPGLASSRRVSSPSSSACASRSLFSALAHAHILFTRSLITYTTVWSLLDLPCYTVPIGAVDPALDAKPPPGAHTPQSETDRLNWDSCASSSRPLVCARSARAR